MRILQIIKRFVPFFLTFAFGLAVASFFVTVTAPNFQFKRGSKNRHDCKRVKWDNKRLQDRLEYLERRNQELESEHSDHRHAFDPDLAVPPPPMIAR